MATNTKSPTRKKTAEKRKRATPVKFHDEKIDSIVKEITEGLKNDTGSGETLEEEVARRIAEKKGEVVAKDTTEEPEVKLEKKEENITADEDELAVEKPFSKEEVTEKKVKLPEEKKIDEDSEDVNSSDEEEKSAAVFAPAKDDNPFPPFEEEKKRNLKWPIIYILLFVCGMVTGFVVFDQLSTRTNGNLFAFATPTPTPIPAPTATPTPEQVDVSAYKIKIENGSGIAGEAAKLQKALEDQKFTVTDVGNADKSSYTKTVLQVKNGTNTQFLDTLKAALKKTYVLDDQTQTLPENESIDAVVIIGSTKAE